MGYTDSSLVDYTLISPNCNSPRNHAIDTITIHMVVGQCSVETLGSIFYPVSRQASSNYGVGTDGRIGLYCHERDRSWCSSSPSNDHRAITIETASDTYYPFWVNEKAYNALIKLCADICKRNGKSKMVWCGSLSATNNRTFASNEMRMTLHKWFADTSCPGYFLESHMQDIANKVNTILSGGTIKEGWVKDKGKWYYYENGAKKKGWIKDNGYWYFTDSKGVMQTGWLKDKEKWYYLRGGDSGRMLVGWQKIKNKWYFLDTVDGYMYTGKHKINGVECTFNDDGALIKPKTPPTSPVFKPYVVKVTADALNIRSGAGTGYPVVGVIRDGGKYTIVKESDGSGASKWGKLKSGVGWISLDYVTKVK